MAIWPGGENLFTDKSKNKELIVAVDESERDMKLLTIYTEWTASIAVLWLSYLQEDNAKMNYSGWVSVVHDVTDLKQW